MVHKSLNFKKTSRTHRDQGHRDWVGAAIVYHLQKEGYDRLPLRTRAELDLTNQTTVGAFFAEERPDYVFLAAAKHLTLTRVRDFAEK